MTTRIGIDGPATGVLATLTASRVTPAPARPFQQVMSASSALIVNGAEAAMTHLPGGAILAAAMRSGPTTTGALGTSTLRAEGSTGTAAASPGTATGTGLGTGDPNIEQVMSQDADQNLYYLKLQEQMSAESRGYSAISNVLKARHDTMKNAIGNIR
jgi:hypothetical protein